MAWRVIEPDGSVTTIFSNEPPLSGDGKPDKKYVFLDKAVLEDERKVKEKQLKDIEASIDKQRAEALKALQADGLSMKSIEAIAPTVVPKK